MRQLAITTITVIALGVTLRVSAVTWFSPSVPEPGGNVSAPLNTSATAQIKRGGLTILGTTIIPSSSSLIIGTGGGTSRICWNGLCKSGWGEVGQLTGYLRLQTDNQASSPDVGYVNLQGLDSATAPAAIRGQAGIPSTTPTYGVYGEASAAAGTSYGLYALAAGSGPTQYAVFADNAGWAKAWAGYFSGQVAISNSGTEGYDLIIGTAPSSQISSRSEICLAGRCRFDWPEVSGAGYWQSTGDLRPITAGKSVAVAGSGSTAPFRVDVATDVNGTPTNASLNVFGGAKFDQYVVGTPPTGTPATQSCGDGICQAPECDDAAPGCLLANRCKPDCDVTPPGNASVRELIKVGRPCNPRRNPDCPQRQSYLYVVWNNPSDADFAGVRVIIRQDRFPTGPGDSSFGDPAGGDFASPQYSYVEVCDSKISYYAGLYAYDTSGNFASGLLSRPPCTDQQVIY